MAVSPLFNFTTVSDTVELLQAVQEFSPYAEVCVICVFVVAFFALKTYETTRALAAALFLASFVTIGFRVLGMLPEAWWYAAVVGLAASIVLLYARDA